MYVWKDGVFVCKLSKLLCSIIFLTMLLTFLSACEQDNFNYDEVTTTTTSSETLQNVVPNNKEAVMLSKLDNSVDEEPFSSYFFEFTNYEDKYLINVKLNEYHTAIVLTIEDNQFNYSSFEIFPPDKYMLNIPYSQSTANTVCKVIKNTTNSDSVPGVLQFDFYLSDFSDETLPYMVSKFYSIKDNEMCEIAMLDITENGSINMNYTEDVDLYYTEPNVLMPLPVVYENENGRLTADVYTYKLDPENMVMVKNKVDLSTSLPIYYGYASHAIANEIYKYFTISTLNVSDFGNYYEIESQASDIIERYFKVDDPRFTTLESLREYCSDYFSDKIVDTMFLNAPQKYREFGENELYTILADYPYDYSLGKLTIKSYIENEDSYTFRTTQEKLDEFGNVTGVIDSGDFVVTIPNEQGEFIISQYRYPYS